ncbi:MAG: hypothetical protein Q4D19_04925 [Lautropia sp.]|nr:hypothetical protein [Lautropia sp.]
MNQRRSDLTYTLPILLLACAALYLRVESFSGFPDKFLWAEDGNVFLNQASKEGLSSIFKPSAGYLHLYLRLVTSLSMGMELELRPAILFAGWFVAWTLMVVALSRLMRTLGAPMLLTASLAALITLQPHNTEVLFNITNAQWMTGPALFFLVTNSFLRTEQEPKDSSGPECLLILLLSLTGPFSIILACALLSCLPLFRPRALLSRQAVTVFIGAGIQLAVLLSSARMTSPVPAAPFGEFSEAFLHMITFGVEITKTYIAAAAIWTLIIWNSLRKRNDTSRMFTASLLLLILLGMVVSSLLSHKSTPLIVGGVGAGSRYNWIPNALVFTIGAVLVIGTRIHAGLLIIAAGVICNQYFLTNERPDLEFRSYARFSQYQSVIIPISPSLAMYPGWHVSPGKPDASKRLQGSPLDLHRAGHQPIPNATDTEISIEGGGLQVKSSGPGSGIEFRPTLSCSDATDIGVEIDMARDTGGFVEMRWKDEAHSSSDRSIRRWYPAGSVTAQFAYPYRRNITHWQIIPIDNAGSTRISAIRYYCIKG